MHSIPPPADISSARPHSVGPHRALPPPLFLLPPPSPTDSVSSASFADFPSESPLANARPLWSAVRLQLYHSEVSAVKRLVGETLIQQNRSTWKELSSLRQILSDFQQQNDDLSDALKHQVRVSGSQHRDLLRRQAQICLEDARSQAEACGNTLEELLPDVNDQHLCDYVSPEKMKREIGEHGSPASPSTRTSTPSTHCSCASSEPGGSRTPTVATGRPLCIDKLGLVAEEIREALHTEHAALLSAIAEQTQLLEVEASRRSSAIGGLRGEPSIARLQQFVHKLQEVVNSPSLRTLSLAVASSQEVVGHFWPHEDLNGGSSVRRLQALIAQRRCFPLPNQYPNQIVSANLGPLPEPIAFDNDACSRSVDPFFDDPFA